MSSKSKLIQIRMPPATVEQLNNLKEKSGLSTTTEVIKYSIGVFNWVIEQQTKGNDIYSVSRDTNESDKVQLLLPI